MILSMTAYGQAEAPINGRRYRVELKSVNNKYNDISIKLPPSLRAHETALRKDLANRLRRGKIFLTITEEAIDQNALPAIDGEAVRHYWHQLSQWFPSLQPADVLAAILRRPEIWQQSDEDTAKLWEQIQPLLDQAVSTFMEYRRTEGAGIEKDLIEKIALIRDYLNQIEKKDPERITHIRQRLDKVVADIADKADPARLEQELLWYMDRLDINEEKQRLRHHLDYFLQTLQNQKQEKGKKLHFIAQEMGREINTIGSKANDATIQRMVVEMKDALEKIKEQTANIV